MATVRNHGGIFMSFADQLRFARQRMEMTPTQLAKAVGLKRADSIYKYERGEQFPSSDTLHRLMEVLNMRFQFNEYMETRLDD